MGDYDFKSLSSYDFALLARDLLQAELGLRLESFSSGPDSGIDFRYANRNSNLIVQSKHFAESGFGALTSLLRRKERQKVDRLAPTRYILATSVSLTPNRKADIIDILSPHCLNPSDVYGREDLNNLLSRHPDIERQHFKLWLTSEPVLRRILHAGVFSDSELHLDRIRLRLCRYVQNPSFDRARSLLDKHHYCIIAGIPGIGKTTLAEVLLVDLVDRHGFEAFRIAHNLDEIRPVKNSKRKQVFYFDDFLGKTALEKLQKNEDQRLVELIEEVGANKNWRFILTTREYILNSAKFNYEAFAQPNVDFTLCVIKLADYTRLIRAKILYNHIYFSDLPKEHKLALIHNKGYASIVQHRNYNPRVIDYMTQAHHACTVAPSLYLNEFINSLEHPTAIWNHAFRYQITEAARHLLIVLGTLPDDVFLADLETAFWTFYRFRQKRFGFATSSRDFSDALKQLDGSFVATKKIGKDILLSFHNPSIRDFLEGFLSNSDSDVADLIGGGHFYEQYVKLWAGRRGERYKGIDSHSDEFLSRLQSCIFVDPGASTMRVIGSDGNVVGVRHRKVSHESRTEFAVRVASELRGKGGEQFLRNITDALQERWGEGHADREDLARLLQSLTNYGVTREDKIFVAAKDCLLAKIETIEEFRGFAHFAQAYPDEVTSNILDQARAEFLEFASDYTGGLDVDDPDWLRAVASDLEFVGEILEVDVTPFTGQLYEEADRIEQQEPDTEPDWGEGDEWRAPPDYGEDVDAMFQSLRDEVESS